MLVMQSQINHLTMSVSSVSPVPLLPAPLAAPPASQPVAPRAPAAEARAPRQAHYTKPVKKISYIGDSIAHNIMMPEIEKLTRTKIRTTKAYGSKKAPGQRFPNSNFSNVVPREMKDASPDVLVLQRDSVTLTNLSLEEPEEMVKEKVKQVSYDMVNVATAALDSNPECQRAILMEAPARYDGKGELNMYGNMMMHKALAESASSSKNKVTIGAHNLDCEGGHRLSRYGDRSRGQDVDMVHMVGPSGKVAYTRSVALILAGAGLCRVDEAEQVARDQDVKMKKSANPFQTQGRRNQGQGRPRRQQQLTTFQLATQNRFGGLQDFC